ncbi:MAG: acetyl-CoA carboxylase biotin carboxylase subunit [Pseudomonadota bacterium]
MAKLTKLLIANRGEIACRIMRTCRELGVASVAVYSTADANARHVREADEAWPIGNAPASESYLNIDALLEAAALSGADAVHPGYGFLSENATFAQRVREAGLHFVGPGADAIELMGSKAASRARMRDAGVPVLPGYDGDDQSDERLRAEAEAIGYPVLIKASAGGGGKGMRVARSSDEFVATAAGARREAMSAFGDDRLIVERYLERPRHIEVQVIGDAHGNVLHLYERECSVQRRHQKIIEETPSPYCDDELRSAITAAAVEAARTVAYENAGTVEFIVDDQRRFYFMEMNTRLQVEHPVTEMITGVDLVAWQLAVAAGEALPVSQDEISTQGHAIECRLYAERPEQDFLPATGTIEALVFPNPETTPGLRIDSGVETGDAVSIHYDPMIAKLICHGEDRAQALHRMRQTLGETTVVGVGNNVPLLGELLGHPAFDAGDVDTTFVDRELAALVAGAGRISPAHLLAAAAALTLPRRLIGDTEEAASPWLRDDHWRAAGVDVRRLRLTAHSGQAFLLEVSDRRPALEILVREEDTDAAPERYTVRTRGEPSAGPFALAVGENAFGAVQVTRYGERLLVRADGRLQELDVTSAYPVARAAADEDSNPTAPMPGTVVALEVSEGDEVAEGAALLTLEGMKMEFTVRARKAGRVEAVHCAVGDMVDAEVPLVTLQQDDS